MTITLFAQPYDTSATGFYFTSVENYDNKVKALRNSYGDPVEEFEIQVIEAEQIDCELSEAVGLNRANFRDFFEMVESWTDHDKELTVVAVGHCGYEFGPDFDPSSCKIEIFGAGSMRELAEQFVEEGMYGDISEQLAPYIDFDAIARDLAMSCFEVEVAGQTLVCESH